MTNREKLKEMFPNTIFIYQKEEDKTKAIVCSDEWLDREYKEPTTKNDLGVDVPDNNVGKIDRPSVTPQEPRWVLVSERLPEEHEWIGTKTFGTTKSDEVYVTFENPKGERFTEHLSFQNGKVSNFVQREIDAFHKGSVPIAWMPLPEPFEPQESEDKE